MLQLFISFTALFLLGLFFLSFFLLSLFLCFFFYFSGFYWHTFSEDEARIFRGRPCTTTQQMMRKCKCQQSICDDQRTLCDLYARNTEINSSTIYSKQFGANHFQKIYIYYSGVNFFVEMVVFSVVEIQTSAHEHT